MPIIKLILHLCSPKNVGQDIVQQAGERTVTSLQVENIYEIIITFTWKTLNLCKTSQGSLCAIFCINIKLNDYKNRNQNLINSKVQH